MTDVVVVADEDNDSSENDDVVPEVDIVQDEIVPDVVNQLTDVIEDAAENSASTAAIEAVQEEVAEVVAEATAVTTASQFDELFRRLDTMQSQIDALSVSPPMPEDIVVVVDDDAPVELDEFGSADGVISDVEEGVPGTEDGPDEAPGTYKDEVDKRPNRKLGWKAYVLGGSGGTGGKRR